MLWSTCLLLSLTIDSFILSSGSSALSQRLDRSTCAIFFKSPPSKIHSFRVSSFLQIPATAATLNSALHSNFCGISVICLGLSFLCHHLGNGSQAESQDNNGTHFMSFLSFKYCKLALFVVQYFKNSFLICFVHMCLYMVTNISFTIVTLKYQIHFFCQYLQLSKSIKT